MWLPRTLRTIFLLLNSCYSFSFAGASSSPCTFNMTCHQGSILRLSLHSLFHFSSSLQICPSIPFLSRLLAVHPSSSSDQNTELSLTLQNPHSHQENFVHFTVKLHPETLFLSTATTSTLVCAALISHLDTTINLTGLPASTLTLQQPRSQNNPCKACHSSAQNFISPRLRAQLLTGTHESLQDLHCPFSLPSSVVPLTHSVLHHQPFCSS